MRRAFLSAAALLLTGAALAQAEPAGRHEWLAPFEAVEVDAAVAIRFEQAPAGEAPSIRYDTQGDDDTKFRAEVRGGVLRIRERVDLHRPRRTTVVVRYEALRSLVLTDAEAEVDGVLTATFFDLTVGARASLTAAVEVQDLLIELSGESRATLTGQVRYLTLQASTGTVDAAGMTCMAARASVQNRARVTLDVTDRLETRTATGATIDCAAPPALVRNNKTFWQRAAERANE